MGLAEEKIFGSGSRGKGGGGGKPKLKKKGESWKRTKTERSRRRKARAGKGHQKTSWPLIRKSLLLGHHQNFQGRGFPSKAETLEKKTADHF